MRTIRTLVMLAIFMAFSSMSSFGQIKLDTSAKAPVLKEQSNDPPVREQVILQLPQDGQKKALEIDRAVLEIQFNQLIDDIDRRFHTPPALQDQLIVGFKDKESNNPKETEQ